LDKLQLLDIPTANSSEKFKGFFYLTVSLIVLWFFLTNSKNPQEVITGILLSVILGLVLNDFFAGLGLPAPTPTRCFYAIFYIFFLLKEIIVSNFDVAYRVLSPNMPIRPGIVVVKTKLKSDLAKLILANSITLTPGTFTLGFVGDTLLIHWIYVTDDSKDGIAKIGDKFEYYLTKIFEG
jgi:multicomponent Na+:H+ antiporter subunit E